MICRSQLKFKTFFLFLVSIKDNLKKKTAARRVFECLLCAQITRKVTVLGAKGDRSYPKDVSMSLGAFWDFLTMDERAQNACPNPKSGEPFVALPFKGRGG